MPNLKGKEYCSSFRENLVECERAGCVYRKNGICAIPSRGEKREEMIYRKGLANRLIRQRRERIARGEELPEEAVEELPEEAVEELPEEAEEEEAEEANAEVELLVPELDMLYNNQARLRQLIIVMEEAREARQINCLYNDATRRCRIRRDGVQENDNRCIYQNNRCVISDRGQRLNRAELDRNYARLVDDIIQGPYAIHVPRVRPGQVIRDTVTTLVEEARLGMVPDRMVNGYYTYGEVDLDVTEKMHDIIKLFNDTRTYASANHIAIRPRLPDIFNMFITDMRNFILYIPTLREQLRHKPLGAIGLFGPLGQLRGRYDLEQGTQYYILNLTTTVIFDKVLHTENARDFGDPEDFPAFIMNMVETCFDNLYGYFFKSDGNLMTNVDSINVVLSNWTELLTSIPGGACLENILNTWIEMFQGPVIDLRIHQNETKAENLRRILNSIRNHLCKTSINLNSNRRIYGDMSLEEKIPLGISYIVNVLDGPNPWEDGDYTIPEGLVEILVSNNIIGSQVSDGIIEPEDLIEQLKGIGPPWGGVPSELVGEEDMNDIRERCVEAGYWR